MTEDARLLIMVGDVAVYMVPEIVIPTSVRWLLPDAERSAVDAAKAWLQPNFMDADGYLLQSIQTYVLKTPDRVILIDTGVGNHKDRGGAIPAFNQLDTPFLDRLGSIGVRPEDVDTVLCTHMHTDHVGWDARLEGDAWVPTFKNARHLFARPEYDAFALAAEQPAASRQPFDSAQTRPFDSAQDRPFDSAQDRPFDSAQDRPFDSAQARLWQDSIEPIVRARLADVVEPDHQVCAEVRLEPSHGHTAGHVSVRVDSKGESAVFIGDAMHSPVQALFPELRCALGGPEEASKQARLAILERYADTGIPLFSAHFGAPCGGLVRREGPAYRFEAIG